MHGCNMIGTYPPTESYPRSAGAQVIGGLVYRGQKLSSLYGGYLYGDEVSGALWMLPTRDDQLMAYTQLSLGHTDRKVVGFGADADGEMYLLDNQDGLICRIDPADGVVQNPSWPLLLSQTPYFSNLASRKLAPGVLSYDVNMPLWSDGATKERGLYLPPGSKITYNDNTTAWGMPQGAVLIKTFLLGGQPIETRLLRNQTDGVHGASYRWNAAATEANLMTSDATVPIAGQLWSYPSRADCLRCHTQAAGQVLGLNTAEMNLSHDMQGNGNVAPQINTLKQLGYFNDPQPADASTLARFPMLGDNSPVATQARAYLNANCAHCHQPGGLADQTFDIRFPTPLAVANVCNVPPQKGDAGVPGSTLLTLGTPETSVMYIRMTSLDGALRMPSLASHKLDQAGAYAIYAWIASLKTCQ
jgi:uncharacterized repeat protein (TIGR03806 family)